jgi:hypothetical protein
MRTKTRKQSPLLTKEQVDAYLTGKSAIRLSEKSQTGEVFTPVSVIDRMLAMLPKAVWRNPALTWCDPACGFGQFPLKLLVGGPGYEGLLSGLATAFPNKHTRLTHIFTNMLTCYDINPEHAASLTSQIRKMGVAKPNVYAADFLGATPHKPYDIIVGNPPYNQGGIKRVGEKRLHVRFTEVALQRLGPNGHLLFVCPPNYREAGSAMNRLFLSAENTVGGFRQIQMLDPNETHRLFRIQARVDLFLYDKHAKTKTTLVTDEQGVKSVQTLDLTKHVPNYGHSVFEKLRRRGSAGIQGVRSAEASTVDCAASGLGKGPHKMLHLIVEGGRKVILRNRPHTHQRTPKLILNGLGVPYVFHDKEGRYGATQVPVLILHPPKDLVAFTKTHLFYYMLGALKITGNNNLPYMLADIPKGYGADIAFTKEEREKIESVRIPVFEDKDIKTLCG